MSTTHKTVTVERTNRPWGWFENIDTAADSQGNDQAKHQIKRLHVAPGQRISLQKHAQRAEHWVVVRGTARVTLGNPDGSADNAAWREFDLTPGQHCDIAMGQVHRLANLGSEPVEIIEVQLGSYLGEDDITRLQDDFGRK